MAAAIFALIVVAAIVAVLINGSHVNSRQSQAEDYCRHEPGITRTSPAFQTCIDQYLSLR